MQVPVRRRCQTDRSTLVDLLPRRVDVEVDLRKGLPAFTIVGLGDRAVRESRERVLAAIVNSGLQLPQGRVTVNLAPAQLRKTGTGFDLAIACGVLAAAGQIPQEVLDTTAVYGELALSGALRPNRGALAVAEGAASAQLTSLVLPWELTPEAALVPKIEVSGASTLNEVAETLRGNPPANAPAAVALARDPQPEGAEMLDLSDVRGHPAALAAATIAAAGGHNLLLTGPPGTGKTMLARRIPSILPPLSPPEALEVTRIHSAVGLRRPTGLACERPFRAPHHTVSASGLVGGGTPPRPGEVTLAHHGVLFLDELSEFARPALEALRQPLEDGRVAVVRGQRTAIFPSRVMLVAATNPCPCGLAGPEGRCRCKPIDHARHRRRLSGPLLDRVDITVRMERPTADDFAQPGLHTSAVQRAHVVEARQRQLARLEGTVATCNAHLDAALSRTYLSLSDEAARVLHTAYDEGKLSGRGRLRVLRIARTIADLAGEERVSPNDVHRAIAFHQPDVALEEAS